MFDGFLADLNQAVSALFFKIEPQKSKIPPLHLQELLQQRARVNLGIFAENVENGSKWLEMSELKRFRHAQIDSDTLRKIWIFDPDPTGFARAG